MGCHFNSASVPHICKPSKPIKTVFGVIWDVKYKFGDIVSFILNLQLIALKLYNAKKKNAAKHYQKANFNLLYILCTSPIKVEYSLAASVGVELLSL